MKKAKKNAGIVLPLVCMFLCGILLMTGCSGNQPTAPGETTVTPADSGQNPGEGPGEKTEASIPVSKLSEFKIVYAEDCSSDIISSAGTLSNTIQSVYGVKPAVTSDHLREGSEIYRESEYEILIGNTNREACAELCRSVRYRDSGYTAVGTKIVIWAGNESDLQTAVTDFTYEIVLMKKGGEEVFFSHEMTQEKHADYALDSITLNGTDITEFTVVYPYKGKAFEEQLAMRIATNIQKLTGYTLNCISDRKTASNGCEILVGATARSTDLAESSTYEGCLSASGKTVQVYGKTAYGNAMAVEGLLSMIEKADNGAKRSAVNIGEPVRYSRSGSTSTVMSFNLKVAEVSSGRQQRVLEMILRYLPDVVGIQEGSEAWMTFLEENLSGYYGILGEGREGNGKGEQTAILYAKERFSVSDSGTKWLTDTPDTPSKMPGADYYRIFTYAVFRDLTGGDDFMMVNTHLDTSSDTVRCAEVNLLFDFLRKHQTVPVILTGDMNSQSGSAAIEALRKSDFSSTSDNTENLNFAPGIDWIFVTDDCIETHCFRVLDDIVGNGTMISDHQPVYAELVVNVPEGGVHHTWEEALPVSPDGYLDITHDKEGENFFPVIPIP